MTKLPDNPDVGRELLATDLRRGQIVLLRKATSADKLLSFWVTAVTDSYVEFYAGVIGTTFFAKRLPDGHITDDSGAEMTMYLYLGTP